MRRRHPWRWLPAGLLCLLAGMGAMAQEMRFALPPDPLQEDAVPVLQDLAQRLLPVYQEPDAERFLDNLALLQAAAGDWGPAAASRTKLRQRRGVAGSGEALALDLYIAAMARAAGHADAFGQAFAEAFRATIEPMDDLAAFALTGWRAPDIEARREALRRELAAWHGRDSASLAEAVALVRSRVVRDALGTMMQPLAQLAGEDDRRRYLFEEVRVPVAGDITIAARVVMPREAAGVPALLEFTVPGPGSEAQTAPAAHGYAGVTARVRGSRPGGRPEPFEHDGEDAAAVVQWIAQQPWSDGRVAMQGTGYGGFAAWAAATRMPAALKAIVTTDPLAPGIDQPMSGGIFRNEAYRWVRQLADGAAAQRPEPPTPGWVAADRAWHDGGGRYRDFDRASGARDRFFQRWINHPSYDRFWQKMIPFRQQFLAVDIPVLTLLSADSPAQPAALHYFREHLRYRPDADHSLLLLPAVPVAPLEDPVQLRYRWLGHVLQGAPRPALPAGRVDFVDGTQGQWRHADSLEGMADARLRLYLDAGDVAGAHLLARHRGLASAFVVDEVDLRQRGGVDEAAGVPGMVRLAPAGNGISWVSEPLLAPLQLAGEPGGRLDLVVDRQDVDISLALYELRLDGTRVALFGPPAAWRASYARDRTQRRLLRPGRMQSVPLRMERVGSHRVAAGSRLLLVLGVNLRPDRQVNYGAGNDVSEESVADVRGPLRLRWYGSSYLDLPLRR